MHFEVDLTEEEGGVFKATAVAYPNVSVTGRTEKEALGLLMEAMGKYMRAQGKERPSA